MARCTVIIVFRLPGYNPIAVPASHERVDKCYEILKGDIGTWICFPSADRPTHMFQADSIAAMILQEESQIEVPPPGMKLARNTR